MKATTPRFKKVLNTALAVGSLGTAAVLVGSGLRMASRVRRELAQKRQNLSLSTAPDEVSTWPKVALMAPCKDLDPDFEENMSMLLEQDYPNYEIIFITVSEEDETHPVLTRLAERSPVPARVVLGGFSQQRCQKLDNILAGVDALDDDFDIYAWVDSDSRVPRDWLRNLVTPLADPKVGATTSFRWYRPEKGRPLTHILGLWTGIQFTHLHLDVAVSVWGGTMAIRKENFEALDMRRTWDNALSDDCVLNDSVRKAGQQVRFMIPCMTSQSTDLSTKDILIFAVRQCVIAKHTLKFIWWASILGTSYLHLSAGRGLWLAAQAVLRRQAIPWTAWGMLSFLPAGMLQNLAVIDAMRQIEQSREDDDPLHAEYHWALYSPAAYLFVWLTLLASATTDRFVWRRIYYQMLNSHETKVLDFPHELAIATKEETPSRPIPNP